MTKSCLPFRYGTKGQGFPLNCLHRYIFERTEPNLILFTWGWWAHSHFHSLNVQPIHKEVLAVLKVFTASIFSNRRNFETERKTSEKPDIKSLDI